MPKNWQSAEWRLLPSESAMATLPCSWMLLPREGVDASTMPQTIKKRVKLKPFWRIRKTQDGERKSRKFSIFFPQLPAWAAELPRLFSPLKIPTCLSFQPIVGISQKISHEEMSDISARRRLHCCPSASED